MKSEIMHYLWKDKRGIYFITDYKEVRADGRVKVDGYGFLEVELVFSHKIKSELAAFAARQAFG